MVGKKIRFVNFLLDTSVYFAFILVFLLIFKRVIHKEDVKWISIVVYFLYYFIFEYRFGQTIGKMITGTRVVSLNNIKTWFFIRILGRTLMRFIPLDIFSYLFYQRGLHDWISKTAVIKIQKH
jgi:uncharacterized RDD family membrane protein YckC